MLTFCYYEDPVIIIRISCLAIKIHYFVSKENLVAFVASNVLCEF